MRQFKLGLGILALVFVRLANRATGPTALIRLGRTLGRFVPLR